MPAADVTLPELALSASVLDRRGDLRADPGLLPALLADPATAVLRLVGDRVAVEAHDDGTTRAVLTAPEPADAGRLALYLGEAQGTAHVGVVADDLAAAVDGDPAWRTLRQVGADLDDLGVSAFATTLALASCDPPRRRDSRRTWGCVSRTRSTDSPKPHITKRTPT